jgi:outer membrane protein assembly factor BamB
MPGSLYGVSSTPVIDLALGELFVAGGNGKLYALKLSSGQTVAGWPQTVTTAPAEEYVYSAITRGMNTHADDLYVETASYCDATPYHGKVEEFSIAQHKRLATWYVTGRNIDGGGIWGQAGTAIDPQGHVFVATGNAMVTPENTGYAEAVVRLSPSLRVQSFHQPNLVGGDVDFGGTPMLFQPPSCPLELVVENKSGVLLVYNTASIGAGPVEALQVGDPSDWQFNAIPAYDPTTNMVYVADSSSTTDPNTSISYSQGLIAFQVKPDCTLDPNPAWSAPNDPGGWVSMSPPTVANGVVYYGNGFGNTLLAYDAATGAPVWDSGSVIQGGIWAAALVANGRLYAGSWDGHLYAFRP